MTDGDSVTINNLRKFENGTFVTLDDYLHLTTCVCAQTVQKMNNDYEKIILFTCRDDILTLSQSPSSIFMEFPIFFRMLSSYDLFV